MKTARSLMCLLATMAICGGAASLRAEDWKTTDGKVYQNIKVVSSTPEAVTILHKDGGAKVAFTKLPPEIQKRFNYDPDMAKAYADEQAKLSHPAPKQPATTTSVASTTGTANEAIPQRPSASSQAANLGPSTPSEDDLKSVESFLSEDQVDAIINGNAPEATSQASTSSSPKVYPSTDPNHHSEDDLVKSITGLRHDLNDPTYHTMAHFALEAQSLGPDPNDKNHHTMDEISGH